MSDELVEEAAKLAYEVPGSWRWSEAREHEREIWRGRARILRDFWAAHAEPCNCNGRGGSCAECEARVAELDTATVLRKAAEHMENDAHTGLHPMCAGKMRAEADRLDREQRENTRDIEIGKLIYDVAYADYQYTKSNLAALGKVAREAVAQVEADQ